MKVLYDHPLADFTTLGIGGPAKVLYRIETDDELIAQVDACRTRKERFVVLGGGSNVVVADRGVPHPVFVVATRGRDVKQVSSTEFSVTVAAGESWDPFVAWAVAQGFVGIECLSGIPGSVGATPIQNVGAYGQEVSDVIFEVNAYDTHAGQRTQLDHAACRFQYRDSLFKSVAPGQYVVLSVTFRLHKKVPATPTYRELEQRLAGQTSQPLTGPAIRDAVLAIRREKSMVIDPADANRQSVGSFFMNPVLSGTALQQLEHAASSAGVLKAGEHVPRFAALGVSTPNQWKVPAAWLIERAGFQKGLIADNAGISSRHALALINRGGAKAEEIVSLARTIKSKVHTLFGVTLRPEPVFIGFPAPPL